MLKQPAVMPLSKTYRAEAISSQLDSRTGRREGCPIAVLCLPCSRGLHVRVPATEQGALEFFLEERGLIH